MRRALWFSAAIAMAVAATAPSLEAKPRKISRSHATLEAATGWKAAFVTAPKGSKPEGTLVTASHESGAARATVVRVNVYNTPAWRKKKHYFADVLKGLKASTPGFALASQKQTRLSRVPILDVRYKRTHETQPHVTTRFVFFRTFTLILTVTSDRARRKAARDLARTLVPDL